MFVAPYFRQIPSFLFATVRRLPSVKQKLAANNSLHPLTMPAKKNSKQHDDRTIAVNRKARHDYFIESNIEAGLALEGWEVKSLRAGRGNLTESYAVIRNGEVFLFGAHFSPLPSASTHVNPEPTRTRKMLMNRREIDRLIGAVERKGYTLVPLKLYWQRGRVKLDLGLAKGKKQHDKRTADKDRDWQRKRARIMKST